MNDDSWSAIIFTVLGTILLIVVIAVGACGYESWRCGQVSSQTGHDTKFVVPSGCFIEADDHQWVPLDRWRVLEGE